MTSSLKYLPIFAIISRTAELSSGGNELSTGLVSKFSTPLKLILRRPLIKPIQSVEVALSLALENVKGI